MSINIAIDGPAGAGKSTLARRAAGRIGFIYVDTGALYRAVALFVLQRRVDPYDNATVNRLLPMVDVELRHINGEQKVYLCGENVNNVIRSQEVSSAASAVSANPKVREFLFDLQQEIAEQHNVIMDGRDIGTIVLPGAQVKIFLTASPEIRAKRRYDELIAKGVKTEPDIVLQEVKDRDYQDSHRAIAPLKPADNSVTLDTSAMTLDEAEEALVRLITDRLEKKGIRI